MRLTTVRIGRFLVVAALSAVALAQLSAAASADLPPPPEAGTPADAADRAALEGPFTPDRIALASRDRALDPFLAFAPVLGDAFAGDALPATRRVLAAVQVAVGRVIVEAKSLYPRTRPYALDESLRRCGGTMFLGAERSYPSGHAAIGAAWGVVLAELLPERGAALRARGTDYGVSRIVCGVHWPSDVLAGQSIGATVAESVLSDPALARLIARAAEELAPFG